MDYLNLVIEERLVYVCIMNGLQMTLSQQVIKFFQNKNKWTGKALSEAIYLTYIGADDYLNFAKNNPNPSDHQKQAFVDQVITSIQDAIKVIFSYIIIYVITTNNLLFYTRFHLLLACFFFSVSSQGGREKIRIPELGTVRLLTSG